MYAAWDVCIKPLRQVVTATSDGALAATELEKYVAAMQRKTGLRADIMSGPCMVVNDQDVVFGKKTMQQVLELIK